MTANLGYVSINANGRDAAVPINANGRDGSPAAPVTPAPVSTGNPVTSTNQGNANNTGAPVTPTTPAKPVTPTPTGNGTTPAPQINAYSAPDQNPDAEYNTAESSQNPSEVPSEQDFFDQLYSQLSPVLNGIQMAESASESAANLDSTESQSENNLSANEQGLAGSSEASSMASQNDATRRNAIAQAKATQATAIGNLVEFAQPAAYTQYTDALARNDANSQAYIKQKQTQLASALTGLAAAGTTLDDLKTSNPSEYQTLLQYAGGDENVLTGMYTTAASQNSSLLNSGNPMITQGNTLVYGVKSVDSNGNPTIKTVTQTLPFNIPATYGWTMNKINSTTSILSDPNNGANYIQYSSDPISGATTVSGSGTGLTALQGAGYSSGQVIPSGSSSSSSTGSTSGSTTSAGATIASSLGVDPTTPLSEVISTVGLGTLVQKVIANEGGSPAGVVNNPGNIKFTGAPGQTDSGVKAADGGTFASYSSSSAGVAAIGSLLTDAASGQNATYGANPTIQSALDTYTNTGSSAPSSTLAGGSSTTGNQEYGLLSTVQGFDPNASGTDSQIIDAGAAQYLKMYLSGTQPTQSAVLGRRASSSGNLWSQVQQRAMDLYSKATNGQSLPNQTTLTGNLGLINGNNTLINSLGLQEKTIKANSDLLQGNITADNINQNAPAINTIIDSWQNLMGNPGVASYLAQNSTLSNELGSLLALKNASGTTVHDKLISADLISPDASAEQEAAVVNTLMKEAVNARQAIGAASANLYAQTDPLGLDPANPINAPGYKPLTASGFVDNYDGSWTDPQGNSGYTVDPKTGYLVSPDGKTEYDLNQ